MTPAGEEAEGFGRQVCKVSEGVGCWSDLRAQGGSQRDSGGVAVFVHEAAGDERIQT